MRADLRAMKSMMCKIQPFVHEARMIVGLGKLSTRFVEPAHIAMMEMSLKLEDCYIKPLEFEMNFEKMFYKIKCLPTGTIHKAESPENYLTMELFDEEENKKTLRFSHPMLSFEKKITVIDGEHSTIPETKVPASIIENVIATANINTRQFKLFLDIAGHETDHLALIATREDGGLVARYINDDEEMTTTPLTYSLGGIEGINLEFIHKDVKSAKSLFSIDYMQSFVNHLNAPTMKIGLANDNPLTVWWNEKDVLSGLFMVAPRIEVE